MLNKKNRLTKRKEFGYIYKNGKKAYSNDLTLIYIETKLANPRFGFVVTKKIGKAVVRNKIKRQLSEIVRLNLHLFNKKFNYIFVAKPSITEKSFNDIKDSVFKLLSREKLVVSAITDENSENKPKLTN